MSNKIMAIAATRETKPGEDEMLKEVRSNKWKQMSCS